ncbi:MAG: hypothetical protein WC003_07030 [Terrimicrobiaceae bacterium]
MKALFWKETRENLKWALLAAAGITAAMFYALRSSPNEFQYGRETWQTLCSPPFLLISSFGFPAVALALGFLQILTELRRDQWAFLVHRPVTRNAIFWGKAFPGAALYLFAVLVPLFGVGYWVSLPGSVAAPFDWRLVQAPLWDAIAALAFYFAALQSGVMSGPWFGRRLLPLVAVCFGAVAIKISWQFPAAVTGALTVLVLSLFSAWAAFLSNGSFRNAPAWGKAAMTFLGLFGVGVLSGWLVAGWQLAFPRPPYTGKDVRITKSGQPVMVTQEGQWMKKVVTFDGAEIHPENKGAFSWEDFLRGSYLPLRQERTGSEWRSARTYFMPVQNNYALPVFWYFVNDRALFARYGQISKRLEGWLGPSGMTESPVPPAAGFDLRPNTNFYGIDALLVCKDSIWRPELNRSEVSKIYSVPEGEKLLGAQAVYEPDRGDDRRFDFALATDRTVEVRAFDGVPIFSIPQISNLGDYSQVELFRMPDRSRYFLLYIGRYDLDPRPPSVLVESSAAGDVAKKTPVPSDPGQPWKWDLQTVWNASTKPFGQTLWEQALGRLYSACGVQKWMPIWKHKEPWRTRTLQFWGLSLLFGMVCAGVGQVLFKRLAIGGRPRWIWTVFLLFYNGAGLLVLACLHEWPRKKRCANCGGRRSVERSVCGCCGASWPPRQPDGTEISELSKPG